MPAVAASAASGRVLLLTPIAPRPTGNGLAMRACQAGHRVLFATASEWVQYYPLLRAKLQ